MRLTILSNLDPRTAVAYWSSAAPLWRILMLDEAVKGGTANSATYNWGVRFCGVILAALTERETKVTQAHASSAVGSSDELGARRRDFNTDRKHLPVLYNSNWLVYQRELNEEKARKENATRVDVFFSENRRLQWTERANQIRRGAEAFYEQFRTAARQPATARQ